MKAKKIDELLVKNLKSSKLRREVLLNHMGQLSNKNIGCSHCPGRCCTFVANSMQVTPIEAIDLYFFLKSENRFNDNFWKSIDKNIEDFRLDSGPHVGAGRAFRKTYTCPFFGDKSLGCSIDPLYKPYGCLAFNATEVLEESGKSCASDIPLLRVRENSDPNEEAQNRELLEELGLDWQKETIPIALKSLKKILS